MKGLYSNFSKLFIIAGIFLCNNIYAQNSVDALRLGYDGLGYNARALGMGNSYIGLSDDGGAAFFNPAGWGLIKKIEFSGSINIDNYDNNGLFQNNYSDNTKSSTRLSNLSFALPFPTTQGSLVFGISYHTTKDFNGTMKFNGLNNSDSSKIQDLNSYSNIPYDLYLTDPNYNTSIKGGLNQSGSVQGTGALNSWTFSGAIEAYKNLFIGLNLNFISGTYQNTNDYYETDTQGLYKNIETDPGNAGTLGFQEFYLNKTLNWDISGWNAKFGMIYQVNNIARVGATIQFPKTYTVKEKFTESGYSQFLNSTYNLDQANYSDQVQYDIITPYELSLGFSFNFRGLIFDAQATSIDYSQLKFDNADGLTQNYVNQQNNFIQQNLKSVLNYNVGAEYTFPAIGLRLRGGFMVMPSAYQGDPSSFDKKYVTGGIGYLAQGDFGIDLAYAHGWWDSYYDNYGTNISRITEKLTDNKIILSMTYRF